MILEALNYALTMPVTTPAHRQFVNASVRLWSRARRCSRAWAPHEEKSKAAVIRAMQGLPQWRTAVVLGSGLLRDVPIDHLVKNFDTVVLVDLVHLASVRTWLMARRYRNVRLISRDLSGYDEIAAGQMPEPLAFLRQVPYLDLVVSANLLSQIGRGVQRQMEADRGNKMPSDTTARLIKAHIEGLSDLLCKSCLITDISYAVIDRTGKVHQEDDLLRGIPSPVFVDEWQWPVAPLGEEDRDYQIVHRVITTA